MAYVYEAVDIRLDRRVALKVLALHDKEGSDFRERFLRESRFAASLDHPNIVPIYEAGESDGLLYIAMRFVRGSNLSTLIKQQGPLDPQRALAILRPVAEALDTAHAAGLVHRDVKPANILLTGSDDHGREHVYLSDFGLTKRASAMSKLTEAGSFIGTMAYISPEQIRGEPLDARTDLYALGCVVYECLTGKQPFIKDDQAALMWAHLSQYPAPLADFRADLAPADPVVAKALAKNPKDRYSTCEEFTSALSAALLPHQSEDLPTEVRPIPSPAPPPAQPSAQPGPTGPPPGNHGSSGPFPAHPAPATVLSGPHDQPGPPPRNTRKPLIIALVAAVLAVATIAAVTWAVKPSNQISGQAQAQAVEHHHDETSTVSGPSQDASSDTKADDGTALSVAKWRKVEAAPAP